MIAQHHSSAGPQHIEIIARGTDNKLHRNTGSGLQPWFGWSWFGDQIVNSDPAAVARPGGKLDVFVRMPPLDQFWHKKVDASGVHEWQSIGAVAFTSSPGVSSLGDRIDVFGRGPNLTLIQRTWDGTAWISASEVDSQAR